VAHDVGSAAIVEQPPQLKDQEKTCRGRFPNAWFAQEEPQTLTSCLPTSVKPSLKTNSVIAHHMKFGPVPALEPNQSAIGEDATAFAMPCQPNPARDLRDK